MPVGKLTRRLTRIDQHRSLAIDPTFRAFAAAVLTGRRRSEVLGLTKGSIQVDSISGVAAYKVRAQGAQERQRDLPTSVLVAIQEFIERRCDLRDELAPDAPVFGISGAAFYGNLKRFAERAGLRSVTPQVLRHSAEKLRRETGSSIEDVRLLLLDLRFMVRTGKVVLELKGQ